MRTFEVKMESWVVHRVSMGQTNVALGKFEGSNIKREILSTMF